MGLLATHPSLSVNFIASSFSPLITRTHFVVEGGAIGVNRGLKKTRKRGIAAARVSLPTPHFLGRRDKSTFGCFNGAQPMVCDLHIVRASLSEADPVTPVSDLDVLPPEEELSQATLIWRAVKLPIYSVAVIPLSVGAAAAFSQSGVFNWGRYWLLFGSSILVITWLNLSNDAYDAETGVDKDKKESAVNITGSQKGVLGAAYACLALGFAGLVKAAQEVGDLRVMGLLTAAILCGYVYQCPPFRLSYIGLGEPLCFMAFGPLATTAFYLCQSRRMGGWTMRADFSKSDLRQWSRGAAADTDCARS